MIPAELGSSGGSVSNLQSAVCTYILIRTRKSHPSHTCSSMGIGLIHKGLLWFGPLCGAIGRHGTFRRWDLVWVLRPLPETLKAGHWPQFLFSFCASWMVG